MGTNLLRAMTAVLALGVIGVTGCKKDDATNPDDIIVLTSNDAADAFASALGESQATSGFTAQVEEVASVAGGGSFGKAAGPRGTLADTVFTRTRVGLYSYNYTFRFSYGFVNANRFDFSYSMSGTYDTPRMSSSDSASATIQVTNLLTGQAYSFAGIYNRYGSQTSKVRNRIAFTSTITIAATDLQVDKSTRQISGGTATLSMHGQSSTGSAFAYVATVTFLGNHQATMLMQGKTYALNLSLGEATES